MSGLLARVTSSSTTPGPGAYAPTMSNKPNAPQYTLKSRHDLNTRPLAAPYRSLPSSIGSGPHITLSSRHETRSVENTPGPSYVPPNLGSDAIKPSMGIKTDTFKDPRAENPGPGAYNIEPKFSKDSLKYTLHGRTSDSFTVGSQSPGPAAYNPNYSATRKSAPSASMHVRIELHAQEVTPGPSDYYVSRELGGHKIAFHGRSQTSAADVTPGPGQYYPSDSVYKKAPQFTMKSRHESAFRPISAPYRALPSTIGTGPKIHLASRHSKKDVEDTPGPSYVPPSFGSDGKKPAFSFRQTTAKDSRIENPGPGAYDIQPKFARDARSSSLHSRTSDPFVVGSQSPGPAAYAPDYTATRAKAPAPSMHVRTKTIEPEVTPGYVDLGSTLTGPKFTIGRREDLNLIPI